LSTPKALRSLYEELIPEAVAKAVVDLPQAAETEEEDRTTAPLTPCPIEDAGHRLAEEVTVGKPREAIIAGEAADALLRFLPLTDVANDR
jgi:hypothetical protein